MDLLYVRFLDDLRNTVCQSILLNVCEEIFFQSLIAFLTKAVKMKIKAKWVNVFKFEV